MASEWERVDQVWIAEVWQTELDRPLDEINDGQDYLSRLDGLLKMEEESKDLAEWIPIKVLGQPFVSSELGQYLG